MRRGVDDLGRTRTLFDPNGNTQTYSYYDSTKDAWLEKQCGALNRCTTFDYDANGKVTVLTDNEGNTTLSSYDALGRALRVAGPIYTDPTRNARAPVAEVAFGPVGLVSL